MASLGQEFFARQTLTVARDLIGTVLEATAADGTLVTGRIVEVEAYEGENDPASHAGRGRTPRSEIMFGPPGHAYVYLIYGMHHCLNFVTASEGTPGAVLIRAVEPVAGRQMMAARRGLAPDTAADRALTAGPGRLCQALGVDLAWNGLPLFAARDEPEEQRGRLRLLQPDRPPRRIATTPRIGIRQAVDFPYRFVDPDSSCLSP